MIRETLQHELQKALAALSLDVPVIELDHPADFEHGDYSSNVAMVWAKNAKEDRHALAERIVAELQKNKLSEVEKIEVAGPGFINFHLSREFFGKSVKEIIEKGDAWGRNETLAGKKVMVEYTDPNPFKVFHIGHLMTNVIGESLACLCEYAGAQVKRANYFGDVGLHIAKALWGMLETRDRMPSETASLEEKTAYLGQAYTLGSHTYGEDQGAAERIKEINKKIYERSDAEINVLYDRGRQWSLNHFETIYKKLGTRFDFYFPESEVGGLARKVVAEHLGGIFEESDGAVVFHAEKHNEKLHTRVFLNSLGFPTYEAKELALAKIKYDRYPYDISVIVTANEIEEYFKVLLVAMRLVFPELAPKTLHKPHGMLGLVSGKMSSRKGNVITGESLLNDSVALAGAKMKYDERISEEERKEVTNAVGVAALKYAILKQAIGKNIIYDAEKSFSFEGDSGPYLQYAFVRAQAVLAKAESEKGDTLSEIRRPKDEEVSVVERLLYQFPEVVLRSLEEYEPHHVLTYLTELAGAFNSYYASTHILGEGDKTPYRLALTHAVAITLKNGLWLLGMEAPERM